MVEQRSGVVVEQRGGVVVEQRSGVVVEQRDGGAEGWSSRGVVYILTAGDLTALVCSRQADFQKH